MIYGIKHWKKLIYAAAFIPIIVTVFILNQKEVSDEHLKTCSILYSSSLPQAVNLNSNSLLPEGNAVLQNFRWTSKEMKDYIRSEIRNIKKNGTSDLKGFESLIIDYLGVMEMQLQAMDNYLNLDSIRFELWKNLSRTVQSRIHELQNPNDCSVEEPIYCCLENPWGFTSQIHDLLSCSMKAYYAKKRFTLVTDYWHYQKGLSWHTFFERVSRNCPSVSGIDKAKCFKDPYGSPGRDILNFLPFDLASDMMYLGRNPLPWWYGQFIGLLMKPNQLLRDQIERIKLKLGFKHPIVGIHVRRTDKVGTEALNHSVNEYMVHAEEYFRILERDGRSVQRRIFVATDDPEVFQDFEERFPQYKILYNPSGANIAKDLDTRYSDDSIWGILLDLYLLASTDHLVCTFSSGMGRLSYELMQFLQPNRLSNVNSLDVPHHYVFSSPWPSYTVTYAHPNNSHKGEIELRPGDVIAKDSTYRKDTMEGKRSDGMTFGRNIRTNKLGFFPTFKTKMFFKLQAYQAVETNRTL